MSTKRAIKRYFIVLTLMNGQKDVLYANLKTFVGGGGGDKTILRRRVRRTAVKLRQRFDMELSTAIYRVRNFGP